MALVRVAGAALETALAMVQVVGMAQVVRMEQDMIIEV